MWITTCQFIDKCSEKFDLEHIVSIIQNVQHSGQNCSFLMFHMIIGIRDYSQRDQPEFSITLLIMVGRRNIMMMWIYFRIWSLTCVLRKSHAFGKFKLADMMKEVKKYISYWRSALPTSYKYCVDFSKNSENILTVSPPSLKHFMEIDQIANIRNRNAYPISPVRYGHVEARCALIRMRHGHVDLRPGMHW